jgi:hypothetical protein
LKDKQSAMKRILFFFLITTSLSQANAQNDSVLRVSCVVTEYGFSYGKPNKNGVVIRKLTYNETNQLSSQTNFTNTGKLRNTILYSYDSGGKRIKTQQLSKTKKLLKTTVYQYNDSNCVEMEITYDTRGKMDEKKLYVFGKDKKNWNERLEYDRRGLYAKTVTEKVDRFGNRDSGTVFDETGNVKYRFKIEGRDTFNNELKKVIYKADGSYLQTLSREWDKNNRLIIKYYEGKEKITYTYNENHFVETETYFNIDTNEPIKILTYSYSYR